MKLATLRYDGRTTAVRVDGECELPVVVDHARTSPRYLAAGAVVSTAIEHLGRCVNQAVKEKI